MQNSTRILYMKEIQMKKIVVFDLDGTLAHTAPTLAVAMNIFLREEGREEIDPELMATFLGNGARVLLKNVYAYLDLPRKKDDIDKALARFFETYRLTFLDAKLYPGIAEILAMLCEKGVTVGVLSNKPDRYVAPLMKHLCPSVPFAFTIGQTDRPKKPDPTVLLELIAKAGYTPEDCIFIGDSDVDINTAKNANVTSCAVSWGYRPRKVLEDLMPDIIADSTEELMKVLSAAVSE